MDVYLNFGVKGNYALNVSYERKIGDGSVVAEIPAVKVVGVEREKGFFGLAESTNVELAVNKIDNATAIVEVAKHEELPVLITAIDSAEYVSLQTEEGKILTRAVYQVRNNVKQFVHLILPKDTKLWSAFVAGKPVKPAKDKNGTILIPLEKSSFSGENLTQFPVEIVYLSKAHGMGWVGGLKLILPKTDIPTSSLNWSLYLPQDFIYFNFGGNVKQTTMTDAARGLTDGYRRRKMGGNASEGRQIIPSQAASLEELKEDVVRFSQAAGALPIKIDIPKEGKRYTFSKLLVTENESPWVSLNFVKAFKQLQGLLKLFIFIVIIVGDNKSS
ncbi:MAG: hypothetical protein NC923_06470 [Candidatus Omnitrophica bacterium]|nr:hypothetical protein [Candidatus Omnitrophota bacterium]